jgi:hypothetical protein
VLDLKERFMAIVELVLFLIGLAMLVVGYQKNNRNVLVGAALILVLGAVLGDVVHGFSVGMMGVRQNHAE